MHQVRFVFAVAILFCKNITGQMRPNPAIVGQIHGYLDVAESLNEVRDSSDSFRLGRQSCGQVENFLGHRGVHILLRGSKSSMPLSDIAPASKSNRPGNSSRRPEIYSKCGRSPSQLWPERFSFVKGQPLKYPG